jgi:hypothetical protein
MEGAEEGRLSLRKGYHLTAHVLYEGNLNSFLRCAGCTGCQ